MTDSRDDTMKNISFLVVDDNPDAVEELTQILDSLDFEDVESADNANDAWLLIRIREFDCIVSALEMPDMSGLALLRIIRDDDRFHKTPFFLTHTAFTQVKVVQAGQAGVTGLIVKPFDAKSIKRKIRALSEMRVETEISEVEDAFAGGMRLIEENDYENALKLFSTLTKKVESAEVYYNIGYIKTAQGLYEEAIVAFQKATQLDRLFAKAFEAMARAYKHLGKIEEAQDFFQKAADIYMGKQKMQDAEEVLNEILQINPDSANVFNSLGVIYRKRGDLKGALYNYRKALRVHPNEPEIHYNIGRLYFDMKRHNMAKSFFEQALKLNPNFKEAKEVLDAIELGAL